MTRITLSLVSHTNVGKTTLARTLLGREVGEVRDAPHVTAFAEGHTLAETAAGDTLLLWDTPGFGDSQRLAQRMRQSGSPIGWLLGQVWDRWRDRPFWHSQQALRHVQAQTDVVLYLVNAAERPEAAGYIAPEMELLAWVGRPVLVLLNQLGAPQPAAAEAADLRRWRSHLAAWPLVRAVLPMDAFARCWVQEAALLDAVTALLEGERREAMQCLSGQWLAQRRSTFDAAMREIAASLGRIAAARQPIAAAAELGDRLRAAVAAIGPSRSDPADAAAWSALGAALDAEVRDSMARLLVLHDLEGRAAGEILARVAGQVERHAPVAEGRAALLGGALTGAITGLKADLASGGLTLGGGMLAGGLLGALGAAGIARGINIARGTDRGFSAWSADAMDALVHSALLRYLAVAHFGRGRGEWSEGEAPPHWSGVVAESLQGSGPTLAALWAGRSTRFDNTGEAERLGDALLPPVRAAVLAALGRLYPAAPGLQLLADAPPAAPSPDHNHRT